MSKEMSYNIFSFVKKFIGVNYFAPKDMICFSIVFPFLSDMLFINHKFNCAFMKKVISFIIIAFMVIPAFGQVFDGYKYVYVDVIAYNSGEKDVYGITASLNNNFSKKGFVVLSLDTKSWPEEARGNPCLVMFCSPSNPYNNTTSKVGITITNCRNEIIFDKDALSINWIDDFQDNVNRALKTVGSALINIRIILMNPKHLSLNFLRSKSLMRQKLR